VFRRICGPVLRSTDTRFCAKSQPSRFAVWKARKDAFWASGRRLGSWNYAAIFQRVTWDRGPQLPCCVIRRMCAIAHSRRERMSISETRVRWTGHFSANLKQLRALLLG